MPIRRAAPKPHVVFVDTNVLWHDDKVHVVAPEFDQAWDANAKLVTLELVVPGVVRGELIFQQVTACWKRLEQVTKTLSELSAISAASHATRLTKERLRTQVEAKVDRWLKTRRARIPAVPHVNIDWPRLVEDAVWRRPPFTFDPKSPETEKGFRDALILETVVSEASAERRDVNIVLLTSDKLLQTSTSARLANDKRFTVHENMSAFASYVKLTRQALENEFIRAIVTRASEKFYTKDDSQSLFLREGILKRLMEQAAPYFANPEPVISPMTFTTPTLTSCLLRDASRDPHPAPCWHAGHAVHRGVARCAALERRRSGSVLGRSRGPAHPLAKPPTAWDRSDMARQDVLSAGMGAILLAACGFASPEPAEDPSWRGGKGPDDVELEWQLMVDPEDDPEPSDPSALHVAVEAQHREFVLHAAQALLAAGAATPDADPIESLAVAQELMALVGEADALGIASADVGDEVHDVAGQPFRDVVFTTSIALRGDAPPTLSTRMRAEGSTAGCGPRAPATGSQHLMFFELDADGARLLSERGATAIVDGIIVGWPSLAASVDQIAAAAMAADGGAP